MTGEHDGTTGRTARSRQAGSRRGLLLVVALLLGSFALVKATPAEAAPGDTIIYGANGYGFSQVVELNLTQRTFQHVGSVARETQAVDQDPDTGRIYWYEWKTTGNEFGYFNPATGGNTIVRVYNPSPGLYMKRMAFAPDGTLYVMDANDRLYTINKTNGNLTLVGQVTGLITGQWGGTGDMAFGPDGTLYIATYTNLYTVNLATRVATLRFSNMLNIPGAGVTVWTGLAFCDGILYASHGEQNSELSALFSIVPSTGEQHLLFYVDTIFNDLTSCPAGPPASNVAPVAQNGSVTTAEDTAVGVTLSATDANGDPLTYSIVSGPTKGTLSGSGANRTYTPNANANGADSFTFRANDGQLNSNTATVSINVTPVNDAPVAQSGSVTTAEDTAVGVTLSASDVDGNPLTYSIVSGPTKGTLSGSGANRTYTPNANANGADSFTFRVNDGTVNSNTATVAINVTPVNDAPVVQSGSVTTAQDTPVGVTLSASDVDGDPLTYTIVAGPTRGSLSGTAPNLTYTPDAGTNGADSFTFRVNDGTVSSNTATVSINVTHQNVPPVAQNGSVTTAEDTAVGVTLSASDGDGDPLTYSIVAGPTKGSLSGSGANRTYTPNADANGSDSFTFRVNDGTVSSNTATVSITITPVNDAPVAQNGSATTDQDVAVAVPLPASDVDGDPLTYSIVSGPSSGSLSGTAPNLTYTPDAGTSGADSFTFRVNDGTVSSNTATVSITVNAVTPDAVFYAPSRTAAMLSINGTQGTSQQVPALSFGTHAADTDPATGLVYYFEWNTTGNRFASWNPATGANTTIRTYNPAPGFFTTQMAFAPNGTLYMIDATARLRTIDKATGNLTDLGPISGLTTGAYGQMGDLTFAPDGTAYVATYGNLYSLNVSTRAATLLHGNMFGTPARMWLGLAHCGGTLYGSDINGATNRSSIYTIDPQTGATAVVLNLTTFVTDLTSCPN